jgi:hypothetical protein
VSERKAFRIQAVSEDGRTQLATGISVVMPEIQSFDEAKWLVTRRIMDEVGRYFADEIVRALGYKPGHES